MTIFNFSIFSMILKFRINVAPVLFMNKCNHGSRSDCELFSVQIFYFADYLLSTNLNAYFRNKYERTPLKVKNKSNLNEKSYFKFVHKTK